MPHRLVSGKSIRHGDESVTVFGDDEKAYVLHVTESGPALYLCDDHEEAARHVTTLASQWPQPNGCVSARTESPCSGPVQYDGKDSICQGHRNRNKEITQTIFG